MNAGPLVGELESWIDEFIDIYEIFSCISVKRCWKRKSGVYAGSRKKFRMIRVKYCNIDHTHHISMLLFNIWIVESPLYWVGLDTGRHSGLSLHSRSRHFAPDDADSIWLLLCFFACDSFINLTLRAAGTEWKPFFYQKACIVKWPN